MRVRGLGSRSTMVVPMVLVGVMALMATACASGSSPGSSEGVGSTSGAVIGCEQGWTDPQDASESRRVARCEPGTPVARPLPEPTAITVSVPIRLEYAAPVLLAASLGEFAQENLLVEFVDEPSIEAIPRLARGEVDVALGAYELALFEAWNTGLDIRAVMGNYVSAAAGDYSVPQSGLWCRRSSFADPADPNPAETQDMRWGLPNGTASVAYYYAVSELTDRVPDFDLGRVQVVASSPALNPTALREGSVDCASLIDPLWIEFDPSEYVLMATQTPGEPLGVVLFGPDLLTGEPAVGDAFVRAVLRTINTYLSGDYHSDPAVMNELSIAIGQPVDRIAGTPSLQFDWELRAFTPGQIQQLFIDTGVITEYSEPVPQERIIDRSFTDRVVGRTG